MRIAAAILAAFLASEVQAQPTTTTPSSVPGMPPIMVSDPGPEGVRIDRAGVFANFYRSGTSGNRPAVLVLGGSEGGLGPGSARIAKALAAQGYAVLQLCYFGCSGLSPQLTNIPLETFDNGLAWLKAQPGVDSDRIAVIGGSKGAEAALLVAARHPELKAVAVGMPSSVAWPGISYSQQMQPGWTSGGAPLPYLPYAPFSAMSKGGVFYLYADGLTALPQHPEGAIPVERIGGPILLICGEADSLWPSCPMSDQIAARLAARGRPAPVILRYANAGHAVLGLPVDKTNPAYNTLGALGGTPDGNAAARADGWPKMLSFLAKTLGE